jgi:hypothetical protein
MANALQSSGLIELNDTEQLGVTDHGKSQPQQYAGREKHSAKGSRNYFKAGPSVIVRLFHRKHSVDSWRYRWAPTISIRMHSPSRHRVHSMDQKSRCADTNAAIKLRARAAETHFNISSSWSAGRVPFQPITILQPMMHHGVSDNAASSSAL